LKLEKIFKNDLFRFFINLYMRKIIIGILLGTLAGIIDVIPMIIQKTTLGCLCIGFYHVDNCGSLIAAIEIKIYSILKGIIIAFMVLLPCAIIIAVKSLFQWCQFPSYLIGSEVLLGYSIEALARKINL